MKKNSLIELYRFILSLIVVKSHSMFIYGGPYFSSGFICVEFFFILTGYLFIGFLEKVHDMNFREAIILFFKKKVLKLGLPLFVGISFNIIYCIISLILNDELTLNLWSYLWYVKQMIYTCLILIIFKKFFKREKHFIMFLICWVLIFTVLRNLGCEHVGFVRGAAALPLGVLIGYIPKLKINKILNWVLVFVLFSLTILFLMYSGDKLLIQFAFIILYPSLIYFTFLLKFNFSIFNFLGSLSFGLYAYQLVPRLFIKFFNLSNRNVIFVIILGLSLLTLLLRFIFKQVKNDIEKQEKLTTINY